MYHQLYARHYALYIIHIHLFFTTTYEVTLLLLFYFTVEETEAAKYWGPFIGNS